MHVTAKELRMQSGKILTQVAQGEEVIVTFRGRALARLIPINSPTEQPSAQGIFGMWSDQQRHVQSVEDAVRSMRKGRSF